MEVSIDRHINSPDKGVIFFQIPISNNSSRCSARTTSPKSYDRSILSQSDNMSLVQLNKLRHIAKNSYSVSGDLLLMLDEIFERMQRVHSPGLAMNPFALEILDEMSDWKERRRIRQAVQRLKNKKLVEISKQGKKCFLVLTKQGKEEALRQKIIRAKNKLPSGSICMVVFDVPESVRDVRDTFRKFLRIANFMQLQRSVWISRFDVLDDISLLIKKMKAKRWINVYYSQSK